MKKGKTLSLYNIHNFKSSSPQGMQARKLAYVEERSQAARNPQPKEKSHSRAEGSCSSTSVADPVINLGVINICFSSGQEWLYPGSELLVPVVQSISVQPLRREPALGHPLKQTLGLEPYNFISSSNFYLRLKRIHS